MGESRHLYLYAKGWYKRGDKIEDLKKIVANITGLYPEQVRIGDIQGWLWTCLRPYLLKYPNRLDDFINDWFKGEDVVDRMLGMMSIIPGDDIEDKILPPNYSILPPPEDYKHTKETLKEWGYDTEKIFKGIQ